MAKLRIVRSQHRSDGAWMLERKRLWWWSKVKYPYDGKFGFISSTDPEVLLDLGRGLWGVTPQIVDHA